MIRAQQVYDKQHIIENLSLTPCSRTYETKEKKRMEIRIFYHLSWSSHTWKENFEYV